MTSQQIKKLRDSWRDLDAQLPQLSRRCYARLFECDPTLRPMFTGDMGAQQAKLIDTLTRIVAHLDRPAAVADELQALGMRHVGYGVREEHYAALENALMLALRDTLGPGFDAQTETAWRLAFVSAAQAMLSADFDAAMFPS